MDSMRFWLQVREQSLGRDLRSSGRALSLLLLREMVRSCVRFCMAGGSWVMSCPSMRRYLMLVISVTSRERAGSALLMREKVSRRFMSESQSGSSLILHSSSSRVCRLLVSWNMECGSRASCGIRRQSCFSRRSPPTLSGSTPNEDSTFSVSRFARLKMLSGRFRRAVLLRSSEISCLSVPIHSGASSSLFLASASSLSLVNLRMGSGKAVRRLLERSRKVRLVRLAKLAGRVAIWLLSDSSLLRRVRLPKLLGSVLIWLQRMLSPSRRGSRQSSSGSSVSSLLRRLSFLRQVSLETESTLLILFLESWRRSSLGKFWVMKVREVSWLSASSRLRTFSMSRCAPRVTSMLRSSRFSLMRERISCSFLQTSLIFCGMMYSFLARSRSMSTSLAPCSGGISKTRYFLRKRRSASRFTRSSSLTTVSRPSLVRLSPQRVRMRLYQSFLNFWTLICLDSIWMQTPYSGMASSASDLRLTMAVQACWSAGSSFLSRVCLSVWQVSFSIWQRAQIMWLHSGRWHFWCIHRKSVWEQARLQSLHTNGRSRSAYSCAIPRLRHPLGSAVAARGSFLMRLRYSTALGSRLVQTEQSSVSGPKRVRPSSQTQWLKRLEHWRNLEVADLTASCISQRYFSWKRTLMSMSLVPSLSLFLTRMTFMSLGCDSLTSVRYSKILSTSLSLEEHLQRMRSPILKLRRSGGAVQRALLESLVSQSSLAAASSPWMRRLRQSTMQECRLFTILQANFPQAFSSRSMCVNPSRSSSRSSSRDCWSKLFCWTSRMKASMRVRSCSMRSLRGSFIHMNMVLTLPPRSCTRMFSSRSRKQFLVVNLPYSYSAHLVRMRRMAGDLMVRCPDWISSSLQTATFLEILRPIAQCVYSFTFAAYFSLLARSPPRFRVGTGRLPSSSAFLIVCSFIQSSSETFSNMWETKSQNFSQGVGVWGSGEAGMSMSVMSQLSRRMMRSLQLAEWRQVKTTSHFWRRSFSSASRLSMGLTRSSMALLTTALSVSGYFFCIQGTMRSSMCWLISFMCLSLRRYFLVSCRMFFRMPSEQKTFVCSQVMDSSERAWKAEEKTLLQTSVTHSFMVSSSSSSQDSPSGTSIITERSRASSSNSRTCRMDFFMRESMRTASWLVMAESDRLKPLVARQLVSWDTRSRSRASMTSGSTSPDPSSLGSLLKRSTFVFIQTTIIDYLLPGWIKTFNRIAAFRADRQIK